MAIGNGVAAYLDSALVRQMAEALRGAQTRILAASIKSPKEALAAWNAGAHVISLPLNVLLALGEHELTEQAVEEFASGGRGVKRK